MKRGKDELKHGHELPDGLPDIQTHAGETTTLSALVKAAIKGTVNDVAAGSEVKGETRDSGKGDDPL
jgi:hypothetical protein